MPQRHRRQGCSRCSQGRRGDQVHAVAVREHCALPVRDIPRPVAYTRSLSCSTGWQRWLPPEPGHGAPRAQAPASSDHHALATCHHPQPIQSWQHARPCWHAGSRLLLQPAMTCAYVHMHAGRLLRRRLHQAFLLCCFPCAADPLTAAADMCLSPREEMRFDDANIVSQDIDLEGGGGRKSWDPGAADMVEAPGCQTEGRWIRSHPSTTS